MVINDPTAGQRDSRVECVFPEPFAIKWRPPPSSCNDRPNTIVLGGGVVRRTFRERTFVGPGNDLYTYRVTGSRRQFGAYVSVFTRGLAVRYYNNNTTTTTVRRRIIDGSETAGFFHDYTEHLCTCVRTHEGRGEEE